MRLIDADALRHRLLCQKRNVSINYSLELVSTMPTENAVPVVRCKDCRYWDAFPTASATPYIHECNCRYPHRGTSANDYCSWGERNKDG